LQQGEASLHGGEVSDGEIEMASKQPKTGGRSKGANVSKSSVELAEPEKRGPHHDIQPAYLPLMACAKYLGCSHMTVYRAIKAGRLKTITIGKRLLIDLSSIKQSA
jgi:excisionase family DNA binding protein